MSNYDYALAVLEASRQPGEHRIHPHDAVEALAKVGLLMPELPESNGSDGFVPDGKEWLPGGPYGPIVWTAPDSTVMVQRIEPGDLTPDEAHFFALAVLAAAQYAQKKA